MLTPAREKGVFDPPFPEGRGTAPLLGINGPQSLVSHRQLSQSAPGLHSAKEEGLPFRF